MHTAFCIHSLYRRVGCCTRHQLPMHILLRSSLAIGPLRPTTHPAGQPLLFLRVRHCCPRRSRTSLVFPCPRTPFYAPTGRAQGPPAHHERTVRNRTTPGVSIWDTERDGHVARDCEPRFLYASLWLARDNVWEACCGGVGDAKCVGVGVVLCAVSE